MWREVNFDEFWLTMSECVSVKTFTLGRVGNDCGSGIYGVVTLEWRNAPSFALDTLHPRMRSASILVRKSVFLHRHNTILRERRECTHADQKEENIADYSTEFRRLWHWKHMGHKSAADSEAAAAESWVPHRRRLFLTTIKSAEGRVVERQRLQTLVAKLSRQGAHDQHSSPRSQWRRTPVLSTKLTNRRSFHLSKCLLQTKAFTCFKLLNALLYSLLEGMQYN